MSIKLKVKSKHLALEAGVIRFEENKLKRQIKWLKEHQQDDTEARKQWDSLNSHRRWEVRNENRATYLARAYIEGREYRSIEKSRKEDGLFYLYIVPRIVSMVIKYKLNRWEKGMKPEEIKVVKDEIKSWSE